MFTPSRTAAALLAGLLLASLGGCAVYPLPYQPPYPSPASNVNNVNHAQAGQAVYAPAYPAYRGAYAQPVYPQSVYSPPIDPVPAYPQTGYPPGDELAPSAFPAQPQAGYDAGYADAYGGSQGQIVDIRRVAYRANPQASAAAGTAIGGIVGGALGNAGSRHWNRGPNTLAGVIAGALIGGAIGTAASYQTSAVMYRVTARMDSGSLRTVDYANPPAVRIGDRVGFDGYQFYH
jgi:outer membrane lipoprotein SlyB